MKLAKARLLVLEDKLTSLTASHDALVAKYKEVGRERDELYASFEHIIQGVKATSVSRNQVLERKLNEYKDTFEAKVSEPFLLLFLLFLLSLSFLFISPPTFSWCARVLWLKEMYAAQKAQFTAVLRASNLDAGMLQSVMGKLDDVLSTKNERIRELQYEAEKMRKVCVFSSFFSTSCSSYLVCWCPSIRRLREKSRVTDQLRTSGHLRQQIKGPQHQ